MGLQLVGDVVGQVAAHLLERLLAEERPQQVEQRPGNGPEHQERRDDHARHLAQKLPVGILDAQPEIELVVGRERGREGERIRNPQRIIKSCNHHLRIRERLCCKGLHRRRAVGRTAYDIHLVGQVDTRRCKVAREKRVVACHVELQEIDRRNADLLADVAGRFAVRDADIVVDRIGFRGEGDTLARAAEILYRNRLNHIHLNRVDVPR